MNDHKLVDALKETTGLTPPKFAPAPQLVQLAQMISAGVADGSITSLNAVFVGPRGQLGWPAFGMQLSELALGLEFARDDLKANMRGPQKIMRAG